MRPGPLHWDQSVGFYAGFRFGVRKDSTPLRGTREVSPAGQETPTERCTTHDSVHDSLARQRTTHWARLGTTVTVAALKLAEHECADLRHLLQLPLIPLLFLARASDVGCVQGTRSC